MGCGGSKQKKPDPDDSRKNKSKQEKKEDKSDKPAYESSGENLEFKKVSQGSTPTKSYRNKGPRSPGSIPHSASTPEGQNGQPLSDLPQVPPPRSFVPRSPISAKVAPAPDDSHPRHRSRTPPRSPNSLARHSPKHQYPMQSRKSPHRARKPKPNMNSDERRAWAREQVAGLVKETVASSMTRAVNCYVQEKRARAARRQRLYYDPN